jgi:TolA-binding protein
MGKFIGIILVIAVIVAAVLWQQGILKFGANGDVTLDQNKAASEVDPYTKANTEFNALQYEAAYASYRNALKEKPNDPEAATAYFCIGKCLAEMHRKDKAIAAYKEFVEKFPKDERVAPANKQIEILTALQ